jgi:hypothetical protein
MARWLDTRRARAPHCGVRPLCLVLAALALSCGGLTTGGGDGPPGSLEGPSADGSAAAPSADASGDDQPSSSFDASDGASEGSAEDDGGAESGIGADCTTTPCTPPLVCCPAINQCTPASPTVCWGPVWVACTRSSDCPGGEVCCVGSLTLESGSFSSACRTACMLTGTSQDPPPDQGFACNVLDGDGGVADCPGPRPWSSCEQVPGAPASLGVCRVHPPHP